MSAGAASRPVGAWSGPRRAALPAFVVLLGSALLCLLFRAEATAAVHVWRSSTAFSHCFLVLPVAAWLAWERRSVLAGQEPEPWPAAALAAVPLVFAWFAAERLGIMEGRQLVAVALLLLFVLCVLGWRLGRAFAAPLLYLFFLVPFGGSLVQPLQAFTARFIDVGLDLLGIPHVVTRFTIEIPEGTFQVAEACAGLRFLIASIAFGVLYACVMYRSPFRRMAFIAASAVVPVIANGVRALGIVVLGHLRGSAEAGAVDHIVYGWLFFSVVTLLLILTGLPFREEWRPIPVSAPARPVMAAHLSRILAAGAVLVLLAAAGPVVSGALERRAATEQAAIPDNAVAAVLARLRVPPYCRITSQAQLDCGGTPIQVTVRVFAPNTAAAALIAARRGLTDTLAAENALASTWTLRDGIPHRWEVVQSVHPDRLVATCLWIGGTPNLSGLSMRFRQAVSSLTGSARLPVLVAFSMSLGQRAGDVTAQLGLMRTILEKQDFSFLSGEPQ